jgi:hypothetical protein
MGIYHTGQQIMRNSGQALNVTSASATQSTVLPANTTGVYLSCSTPMWIEFATSASVNTGLYLAASVSPFWTPAPASAQVSARAAAGAGLLYIKPTSG